MSNALFGYTGFVGSNILRQCPYGTFDALFNSKNVESANGGSFDLGVVAAAPGTKWLANANPHTDYESVRKLIDVLATCKFHRLIIISTVDVFHNPIFEELNEPHPVEPYGKNRMMLEDAFADAHIIRLPGLYGPGLKKNTIYDLMNFRFEFVNLNSCFQWYDVRRLWRDIKITLTLRREIVHLVPEPVETVDLLSVFFRDSLLRSCFMRACYRGDRVEYNLKTIYDGPYIQSKAEVVAGIEKFLEDTV